MKIGINDFAFKYPSGGLGLYLIHMVNTLVEIDQQNEYVLLGPDSNVPEGFHHPSLHSLHTVPAWAEHNHKIKHMLWEQWTGPAAAQRAKVDVFHNPYFCMPLFPRVPTIVTLPDAMYYRLPEHRSASKVLLRPRMLAIGKKAAMVITLSNHARQDIIDLLSIPPERVRVIYLAAGENCYPVLDPRLQAEARVRYGLDERYIFYIGNLDKRKNVPQLIRAFARLYQQLGDPHLQLFIAGDPDKHSGPLYPDPRPVAEELGVADRIIYRYVEEKDKAALFSGAAMFVYLSSYEGFGLPPLEAMKCGAPVICSNRTSLPEVVGEAALCVNPDDTQAVADAMYGVLTNQALRAELRERSLKRAELFSWRKTAVETLAVYEEVFRQKGERNGHHVRHIRCEKNT
jgi:glycosyltransferase involved in cell wall biosynthesis